MKAVLVNYNFTPDWVKDYNLDYLIYDRSDEDMWLVDFPKERILKTKNVGNVDYDKLSFLVDFYDNLPDVFLWGKSNLFKYITKEGFDKVKDSKEFTPLLTQNHKTYSDKFGPVCFYHEGMYYERNDSWFLQSHPSKYFKNWNDWASEFQIPTERYIPFPPGGNFILTKERVHRFSRDTYMKMRALMDYTTLPGEAQCAERIYYLMWR